MKQFDPIPPSVALKVTLRILAHLIVMACLLLGIGYVDAKGEEIDKGINTMLYGNK